jgi:chemotaxis protein histidine kinase CheA
MAEVELSERNPFESKVASTIKGDLHSLFNSALHPRAGHGRFTSSPMAAAKRAAAAQRKAERAARGAARRAERGERDVRKDKARVQRATPNRSSRRRRNINWPNGGGGGGGLGSLGSLFQAPKPAAAPKQTAAQKQQAAAAKKQAAAQKKAQAQQAAAQRKAAAAKTAAQRKAAAAQLAAAKRATAAANKAATANKTAANKTAAQKATAAKAASATTSKSSTSSSAAHSTFASATVPANATPAQHQAAAAIASAQAQAAKATTKAEKAAAAVALVQARAAKRAADAAAAAARRSAAASTAASRQTTKAAAAQAKAGKLPSSAAQRNTGVAKAALAKAYIAAAASAAHANRNVPQLPVGLSRPTELAADSMVKASTHEQVGPKGLWGKPGWQLPDYIEHVANDLIENGHPESQAVQMAVGIIKNWASGRPSGGEKRIKPSTVAAARKALAEWESLKARAKTTKSVKTANGPANRVVDIGLAHQEGSVTVASSSDGPRVTKSGFQGGQYGAGKREPKTQLTASNRRRWAKIGVALPDGSFPIPDRAHLAKACRAIGRAPEGKRPKVKAHIRKRAKALGVTVPNAAS